MVFMKIKVKWYKKGNVGEFKELKEREFSYLIFSMC